MTLFTDYCSYSVCVHMRVCRQISSVQSQYDTNSAILRMWKAGYSLIICVISMLFTFLNSEAYLCESQHILAHMGLGCPGHLLVIRNSLSLTDNSYAALTPQVVTVLERWLFLHFAIITSYVTRAYVWKDKNPECPVLRVTEWDTFPWSYCIQYRSSDH